MKSRDEEPKNEKTEDEKRRQAKAAAGRYDTRDIHPADRKDGYETR